MHFKRRVPYSAAIWVSSDSNDHKRDVESILDETVGSRITNIPGIRVEFGF